MNDNSRESCSSPTCGSASGFPSPCRLVWGSFLILLLVLWLADPAHGQHDDHTPEETDHAEMASPLHEPGHAIFGTVQEAIAALEADTTTDWSQVDVDRLREHLIDMHHVAMHVEVRGEQPLDDGVELTVAATTDEAHASLERVLDAHPAMLEMETGWTMDVTSADGSTFTLRVTDPDGRDADKIQAPGYIGLLAYGEHHQHHHWMMIRGDAPHDH